MPQYETVDVCIDDEIIATKDFWAVIHPVWWIATIYDGPDEYERSLKQFSKSQRFVFALCWYREEVDNGGHDQFYSNSTGIVWKDAQAAFDAIGIPEGARIIEESAKRLGGSPSFDREERQRQFEEFQPVFDDLDDAYYALDKSIDIDAHLIKFIRERPTDFHFVGKVTRVVLPNRNND